ncbi:MAG: hypothetical protein II949_11150 [Prevotella sp.]|nr:hypothetical protein [Prevotella sp.]
MLSSENQAMKAMGTTDGLYAGVWIVTMNRRWTNLAGNNIGAVLWGARASAWCSPMPGRHTLGP